MELTKAQRWILSNQFRILEILDPNNVQQWEHARLGVEEGYAMAYEMDGQYVEDERLDKDGCLEVLDVLDMFTQLEQSYQGLENRGDIEEWEIEFPGWDGNNEGEQRGFAEYFCKGQHKFQHFGERAYDLNSYSQNLQRFRIMIKEWKKVKRQPGHNHGHLTEEEIISIVTPWRELLAANKN